MAEWSMAAVLKTVVQQCTGGSNPSSSASKPADAGFLRRKRDSPFGRPPSTLPSPQTPLLGRGARRQKPPFVTSFLIRPPQAGGMWQAQRSQIPEEEGLPFGRSRRFFHILCTCGTAPVQIGPFLPAVSTRRYRSRALWAVFARREYPAVP